VEALEQALQIGPRTAAERAETRELLAEARAQVERQGPGFSNL